MCGISGFIGHGTDSDLRRMTDALAHRGPDEAGYTILNGGHIGLGHLRLSIMDLQTGQQPMFNEDGSLAVVVNGEIYDYREIRRELEEKGHRFRSTSDSELILHLYEEHGLELFDKLNGEFAFILWDQNRRRLVAARDRAGIKPLFYHRGKDEFLFGSEVKAIFALPRVERKISGDYLKGPFLGAFSYSQSAFENVSSVKPGHFLVVQENGEQSEHRYWRMEFKVDERMTFAEAKEQVRNHLKRAVQRRLVADVPVGAYLSGGLDSTIVCGLMAQAGAKIQAFNISFQRSAYDESPLARRIAEHYGLGFETMDCSMEWMAENFSKTIYHVEMPVANPGSIARTLLSQLVHRRGQKVCLTGEGSDEVFGGYPYFKQEQLWSLQKAGKTQDFARLWKRFQQMEKRSEGMLWSRRLHWGESDYRLGYPNYHVSMIRAHQAIIPRLLPGVPFDWAKDFPLSEEEIERLRSMSQFNAARSLSFLQLANYIIPALGDRTEMTHSVECRQPFLDRDLMDFAGTIPPAHFLDLETFQEKLVLREAFRDLIPDFMWSERKHPFLSPNWRSFYHTKVGKDIVRELLSPQRLQQTGMFGQPLIKWARRVWAFGFKSSELWRNIDVLLGSVLSAQMLHHLFIEQTIPARSDFPMVERRP